MTDEEAARLRAQVHEATRVLSGSYTIPAPRQTALTEEYTETFAAAVERLLDDRLALITISQAVMARFHERGQCPLCDGTLAHTDTCPITQLRSEEKQP